jgi:hypothetical protein
MKKFSVLLALVVLSLNPLVGKIRNGYEPELLRAKESLRILTAILVEESDIPHSRRLRIKLQIEKMINHISCYALTEELLAKLRLISPAIYHEIDTIKDKRGRPTDVYVRFMPTEKAILPLEAVSFFAQGSADEDANLSIYGEYSVAVDICIESKSLLFFCHELGHVKYVVPNLASFRIFYSNNYKARETEYKRMGHALRDPSGHYAEAFERRFLKDQASYLSNGGNKQKSPFTLIRRIKNNVRKTEIDMPYKELASITHP